MNTMEPANAPAIVTLEAIEEQTITPHQAPESRRQQLTDLLAPFAVFCASIGLWYFVNLKVMAEHRRFLLPLPHDIIQVAFIEGFTLAGFGQLMKKVVSDLLPFIELSYDIPDAVVFDNLQAFWLTIQISILGLLIATILGSLSAMAMAQARWVERAFFPYAVLFQAIPILALVPLIGSFFGYGFWSRIIVCVLITFFPIVANTLFGLKSVDRGQNDLFRLHTTSRLTRLRSLQIPASMPSFFTGLRIAAGLSVVGSIVGGIFFQRGEPDLGSYIGRYFQKADNAEGFGVILLSSFLGIAVFVLFGKLSDRVIGKWYDQTN